MKCYHCNKNEAEYRFFISFQGHTGEVRLCASCLEELQEYAMGMFRDLQRDWAELLERFEAPNGPEAIHGRDGSRAPSFRAPIEFPDVWDPGEAVRDRRRLNELRVELETALASEDYELAIKLRDEINNHEDHEKGVRIYDA
jgi:protein-arginine kinase activator protein McsA